VRTQLGGVTHSRWRRHAAAFLALTGTAALIAVIMAPAASSSRAQRCLSNKKLEIFRFDPHFAKAGSNTVVHVDGSNLGVVALVEIGPKGRQTFTPFTHVGDSLEFTVPMGAVTGKIFIQECGPLVGAPHTAWSDAVLHV
jgi:hypothetical protein